MLGKPRNRRRRDNDARTRWRLPEINWRRLFVSVTSVVAVCLAVAGVLWTLDQPIQRVSVSGRFQHVAPVDVERIVKEHVRGMGLLSVDLAMHCTRFRGSTR
jgi:hypothetical protein